MRKPFPIDQILTTRLESEGDIFKPLQIDIGIIKNNLVPEPVLTVLGLGVIAPLISEPGVELDLLNWISLKI